VTINLAELPDFASLYGVAGGVAAGDTLYISGQPPIDKDRRIVGDNLEEQARLAFDWFTKTLEAAGFDWDDVVKVTAFIMVDGVEAMETYFKVLKEYLTRYSSRDSVAHTYVVPRSLVYPEVLLEVEGIAVRRRL
jgi:2-iminobutanoate/2-iminopropanoate deaminase